MGGAIATRPVGHAISIHRRKVDRQRRGVRPKTLELVVRTDCRVKDVNHDADKVQQCPAACPNAFGVVSTPPTALDHLLHALGERADVRIRCARCDHEEIGGIADLPEVEHDDVQRLVVIECADREAKVPVRIAL